MLATRLPAGVGAGPARIARIHEPVISATPRTETSLVAAAMQRLLATHHFYPGVVIDRCWNMVLANTAALLQWGRPHIGALGASRADRARGTVRARRPGHGPEMERRFNRWVGI